MRHAARLTGLCLLVLLASVAQADTLTVSSNADSGAGTLRDAISAASPGDTIVFAGNMTIVVASTLTISQNLTINATGRSVVVDGNDAVGVFLINNGATVRLTRLTVRNGRAFYGGGVANYFSTVTLTGCTVSGNHATDGGGGITNNGGEARLTLIDSSVSSNDAANYGGAIYNVGGTAVLSNSTLSNNTASGAGSFGGAIYNYYGTVTLTDSTASGNSAVGSGGGLYNNNSTATLSGSTVSGNSANNGGGLYNIFGIATLTNSTFASNLASTGGGIQNDVYSTVSLTNGTFANNAASTSGGGIYNLETASVTLRNTLVADGCAGTASVTDSGGNLDSGTSCAFSAATSHGNATLDLGTLADNGGPTRTILPGVDSAAINAVSCANAPPVDQRGYLRPDPGSVGVATPCDVGAVEAGSWRDPIFASGFDPLPIYH